MKITKTPKRLVPATLEVSGLLARISAASNDELPDILDSISEWCWPRGDLYYWTGILNRFDTILEETCKDYELSNLQTNEFTPRRKRLLVSLLRFSRLLIENCTNRKLYNSYEHLNDLLLSRDLDVLEATLRLALRPAQQHSSHPSRHEFQISKERLTTLTLTWTPRDHGLSLADIAKDEKEIPADLYNVRFQFFKRNSQAAAPGTAAPAIGPSTAHDDEAQLANTPTRPRARDGRPMAVNSLSAANLPTTPIARRTEDRGEGPSSGHAPQLASRKEGLTTVDLGRVTDQGRDAMDILADAVEAHGIPKEERFEIFQKIRLAMSLTDTSARRQILVCRLLAIACYAHTVPESTANTQLFLYEPDLVHMIAALVDPVQKIDMAVRSSALYALDSLARYRGKLTEVLNSVNASVNHGIILSVLRSLIEDLATDDPKLSDHFVDSLFSFVAFITASGTGSNMIVGAGLIPILVQLIKVQNPNTYMVQRTVSRATGLVDSVVYNVPHAFDLFCNARGLDALVERIQQEVDRDIADSSENRMDDSVFGEPGPDNLYGKLAFGRALMLRNMFKSISQMMTSIGTGEGLRNLIDGLLPTSLKKIIDNRKTFGPQILALAINIMTTFIHNEPTSLSIIQESKLPEAFYVAIEEDIEASFDVIVSIPNAVGALCLNQAGLDLFNSRQVISTLFALFTSERHSRVFQDRDNASIFGSSIDELIRHQPSIKQSVMDSIMRCLNSIEESGMAFTMPESTKARSQYGLLRVPAEEADVAVDTEQRIIRSVALADVITDEPDPIRKDESSRENNAVVISIDVTARFLEGLFQTTSHCKDFLKLDGLEKLLGFYSLPCLPYDFSTSMTADSLVTLVRYMAEISPSTVLLAMLRDVKRSLDEARPVWERQEGDYAATQGDTQPKLLALAKPHTDEELEAVNAMFRKLVSLSSRTHLLSDICQTFTYAGHKMPTTFLQTLVSSESAGTVSIIELGRLYRACAWENMLLKAALPPPPKGKDKENEANKGADVSSGEASRDRSGGAQSGLQQAGVPADLLQDLAGTVEQPGEPSTSKPSDEEDPKFHNAATLRFLASQVPVSLTSFFQETVRLLAPRRNVDAAHKKAAHETATEIAKVLQEHLQWKESQNSTNSFAFATMMVCQASCLIFDDRPSGGSVQTAVLRSFEKAGGMVALFSLYRRYIDEIDHHYNADGEEKPPVDIEAGLKLGHTCGGLKVLLGLFLKLVTAKGLSDSPQTTQLTKDGGMDPFEPHQYLVVLRSYVLPYIRSIWDKPWLPSLPASVNRLVLQNVLVILRASSETAPTPPKKPSGPGQSSLGSSLPGALASLSGGPFGFRRIPAQPDEDRIRHLTDMGFPRNAARHALARCQNNLSAATEYLLMHPEIVSQMAAEPDNEPGASNADVDAANNGNASDNGGGAADQGSSQDAGGGSLPEMQETDVGAMVRDDTADGNDGERLNIDQEDEDAQMKDADAEDKPKVTSENVDHLKDTLEYQRNDIKQTLTKRALELADVHESLVFEVKNAFLITAVETGKISNDLSSLLENVRASMDDAFGAGEKHIALRLRLLALVFHEEAVVKKIEDQMSKDIMEALVTLSMLYVSKPATPAVAAPTDADAAVAVASATTQEGPHSTKWLASLILVSISLLGLDEDTVETRVDSDSVASSDGESSAASDAKHSLPSARRPSAFESESEALFDFAVQVLERVETLNRDDLLAVFRLLSVLTRRHTIASSFVRRGGIPLLFKPFLTANFKDISGCQSLAVMVLRHVVEDLNILSATIDQELQGWFVQVRKKDVDTTNLLRQLDYAALRDPDAFLKSAASKLEMVDYFATKNVGHVKLIEPAATEASQDSSADLATNGQASLASLRLGDEPMDVPASPTKESAGPPGEPMQESKAEDAFGKPGQAQANPPSEDLDSLMQFLLSEMLRYGRDGVAPGTARKSSVAPAEEAAKVDAAAPAAAATDSTATGADAATEEKVAAEIERQKKEDASYFYTCFIMQCMAELLSSYTSCKMSFVNFSRKRLFSQAGQAGVPPTTLGPKETFAPGRAKLGVLNFFLTEMVPAGFLQSYEAPELRKRMAQSNWAMSVIVALAADVTVHADVKKVPHELLNARKAVLDAIARAIKDASASSEPIEVRYGRLFALSDLCYRLLIARPNTMLGKQTEDLTLHMAKTMLEKNFVTVLTSALADVDLNLPTVKSLLDAILRPLEHLTKVAIKMGKTKEKQNQAAIAHDSDEDTYISSDHSMDDEEDEDEDEVPGREETPDFYRNSSLGMHTGEMEQGFEEDEISDDMMEDEEDVDMEEFDTESGSEMSSESDEDEDDHHVVEVMDSDDESMYDSSDQDDDDEDGMDDGDEDGDGWTDDDDEEVGSLDDEDEALDFVFDHGEGGLDGINEALDDGMDTGMMAEGDMVADTIIDDEEADMMDDDSIEDHYENEELSHLELAEDYAAHTQPDDRFGANWGWTALPEQRGGRGIGGGDRHRDHATLPPNFFLPAVSDTFSNGPTSRRSRLVDLETSLLGGSRRPPALNEDVASHPLLVDNADSGDGRNGLGGGRAGRREGGGGFESSQPGYTEWAQSIEDLVGDGAMQFLETLLNRGGGQNQDIRIELTADGQSAPRMRIDGVGVDLGRGGYHQHLHHHPRAGGSSHRDSRQANAAKKIIDPVAAVQAFTPQPTSTRWSEESRILHPTPTIATEKCTRLRPHLIKALMPSYKKKQEADRKKKEKSEAELKEAQEARDKIKKELEEARSKLRDQEERARQEQAQAEAEAAAARAEQEEQERLQQRERDQAASEQQVAADTSTAEQPAESSGDVEMTDAEPAEQPAEDGGASTDATTTQRVTTRINGEEIDITDTGIDPTFLEALPDDMREEVVNQHFRERRAAEASSNLPQPSSIAADFLDALPPEIRAEVIQQEAIENSRRRMREQIDRGRGEGDGQNRAEENQAGSGAEQIDPAEFLTSLNPELRNQVLLEQDDSFLGSLPTNLMAEVNELRRQMGGNGDEARIRRTADAAGGSSRPGAADGNEDAAATGRDAAKKPPPPRDAIQLLDKPGVATLVRLLFFPQMNGKHNGLHKVLANLSENSKTRAELLSLLLMVLSEGITDASAVDKSFVSMSNRANKIHATPSRPTPKRFNSGPASSQHHHHHQTPGSAIAPLSRTGDEAPFLIASRSIETLLHLTYANELSALYFLRDDSRPAKKPKGKGKDQDKERGDRPTAPINILLSLLSKDTILSNSQLVDSLLALLSTISKPLAVMAKGREASSEPKKEQTEAKAGDDAAGQGQPAVAAGTEAADEAQPSTSNATPGPSVQPAAAEASNEGKASNDGNLTSPPFIPTDRLSAIVKPLATAISSKGFQHTLTVASHLSTVEGGQEVISEALRLQADAASKSLVLDLDKLIETLPEPSPEEDEVEEKGDTGSQMQQGGGASAEATSAITINGPTAMDLELAGNIKFHSTALTSLASPASAQAILLRSLRALDYIMTGR